MTATTSALALALAVTAMAAPAQDRPCDDAPAALAPSRDLYCIELIAVPGVRDASGRVELARIPGPFTIAVAADGSLLRQPVMLLAGLPAPSSLGAFTSYVAWIAAPLMHPVTKLGEVRNGRTVFAPVGSEKFTVL